jgi:hypothetical protein
LEDVFLDQNEQETLWSIFDSYCKTVIRNTSRDIGRRYKRQLRNEVLVDFSSGGFLDETTVDQDFSIERQFITYKVNIPCQELQIVRDIDAITSQAT